MIRAHYENRENCFSDIAQARKLFQLSTATKAQWEALDKGLGLMFVYCPADIQPLVEATMLESDLRRPI